MNEGFIILKERLSDDLYKQLMGVLDYLMILSDENLFLKTVQDKTCDWQYINKDNNLFKSYELVKKFRKYIDWEFTSICEQLPDGFIREFHKLIYWYLICEYQKLSEECMKEFKDKLDWYLVSKYQLLSEDFIEEFADLIYWGVVFEYQYLTIRFKIKHEDKV